MNTKLKNRILCALGAVSMALAPMSQASGTRFYHSGTNAWMTYEYIDFLATGGAGHDAQWATYNFAGTPLKYFPYKLEVGSSEGICYEISTGRPDFYPAATGDTRLWIYDFNTGAYKSLDDDGGDGNYSKGRAFLKGPNSAWVSIYTAAFSTFYHDMHFGMFINRLNLTEAQCTTGQAVVPWVKVVNGVMTFSANAN